MQDRALYLHFLDHQRMESTSSVHHKTVIYCNQCKKKFSTPSAHRAHQNLHALMKFICETCGKNFAFSSSMWVHQRAHSTQWLYRCFAGSCTKCYKWPQDLHCHVINHLNKKLKCPMCTYVTTEKRLLNRHKLVHDNWPEVYRFCCKGCDYRSKYYSPYHKHLKSCKGKWFIF